MDIWGYVPFSNKRYSYKNVFWLCFFGMLEGIVESHFFTTPIYDPIKQEKSYIKWLDQLVYLLWKWLSHSSLNFHFPSDQFIHLLYLRIIINFTYHVSHLQKEYDD